jgi:hypothetical protein
MLHFLTDNIFIPLLGKYASFYFLRPVFSAVKIEVRIIERGLAEYLASPGI